jgi:tetratricopeptide (TPR) repeat protein
LDLGIVYMEAADKDAAIRELTKAAALEPDNVTAHFRLAKVYQSMGKRDEAKAEFVKANLLTKTKDDAVLQRIAAANAHPDANHPDPNIKSDAKGDRASPERKPDAAGKPEKP